MKTFKEYINESYKKVSVELGDGFSIEKLGYDTNGNWSYMVSLAGTKSKKIQHQGEWERKITKDDNKTDLADSKIATEIKKYYEDFKR